MSEESMPLVRLAIWGGCVFLGSVAVFLGGVVMLTSWQSGAISLSYNMGGRRIDETVTRVGDAVRFWRTFGAMGLAPTVIGLGAVMLGLWNLRNRG